MAFPRIPKRGHRVRYGDAQPDEPFRHRFCGAHDIPGSQCPNCDKQLTLMLELDTSDPRLELSSVGLDKLPLLYCWTCHVAQAPFFYKLEEMGGVQLLEYASGSEGDDFPYEDYPPFFPESRIALVPVPPEYDEAGDVFLCSSDDEERKAVEDVLDQVADEDPVHQVGGVPYLVQLPDVPTCPTCAAQMPFVAVLAADNLDPRGFTGEGGEYVQSVFHLCPGCRVVGAYHLCD